MKSLVCLLFSLLLVTVHCNLEVDILNVWKINLIDPNNVLESWDPTLVNPCTWFHVTCNGDNTVTRLDLGNANLSGILVPQLGRLTNLQYLEVYDNDLSGSIPSEIGRLRHLISLDLYNNNLTGVIPPSLGYLKSLAFLRLNGNSLSGRLPDKVLQLVQLGKLKILDVSDNQLIGTLQNHKNKSVTTIIQDAKA